MQHVRCENVRKWPGSYPISHIPSSYRHSDFKITKKKWLKIHATKSFTDYRSHSNPILYYICFSDPAHKIRHKSGPLKTDGDYQY